MDDFHHRRMRQFRIAYTATLLLIIIVINYALFSPNWRDLIFSDSYYLINPYDNETIKESVAMEMANVTINVAKFLNEPKLVIPRRMDENDMINSNWSMEMDLIENYSISKNIYNSSFKQLNNTNQFCSLWYSEKPISDTIVMVLIIFISLLDFVALIIALIDYDLQLMCKMSPVASLLQLNLILAFFLTTAIALYAYQNKEALDKINHVVKQLANDQISTRCTRNVDVSVGSGFYFGCVALFIHWILNFGTALYWKWPQISRLIANF
ncbi:putative integral membrane protein [Brugia pahangi]